MSAAGRSELRLQKGAPPRAPGGVQTLLDAPDDIITVALLKQLNVINIVIIKHTFITHSLTQIFSVRVSNGSGFCSSGVVLISLRCFRGGTKWF